MKPHFTDRLTESKQTADNSQMEFRASVSTHLHTHTYTGIDVHDLNLAASAALAPASCSLPHMPSIYS